MKIVMKRRVLSLFCVGAFTFFVGVCDSSVSWAQIPALHVTNPSEGSQEAHSGLAVGVLKELAQEEDAAKNEKVKDVKVSEEEEDFVFEEGIPSSVQKILKRLSEEPDNLTLKDLNDAREAEAKLDALLVLEKKLVNLEAVRQERAGYVSSAGLSAMLPPQVMQSIAPTPMTIEEEPLSVAPAAAPAVVASPPPSTGPERVSVISILGAAGNYSAVYMGPDGKQVMVRRGGKMEDGSFVRAISKEGVTLVKDGKSVLLPVQNVGRVFGANF